MQIFVAWISQPHNAQGQHISREESLPNKASCGATFSKTKHLPRMRSDADAVAHFRNKGTNYCISSSDMYCIGFELYTF